MKTRNYRKKPCERCGAIFKPNSSKHKYCKLCQPYARARHTDKWAEAIEEQEQRLEELHELQSEYEN